MTLQDIYDQLSYGELRDLFLAVAGPDALEDMPLESYAKVLPSVQLGLTELHKRFFIREGQFYVELQTDQSHYKLTPKYAQSNTKSSEPVKYIIDTIEPFTDNLFKVERVLATYLETPTELDLNERGNAAAVHTNYFDNLVVPTDSEKAPWLKETTQIDVRFRANHPKLDANIANVAPTAVQIDLPPMYLEALCLFVASRLHNPIGMTPEGAQQGSTYFQKFLASCDTLKRHNFEIDDFDENTKLYERGFC